MSAGTAGRTDLEGGPRVLFFGTYDAATHPRVAVLRDGLRGHGVAVHEVNVPLGLSTASRVAMLRRPWTLPLLGLRLLRCWTALVVRSRPYRAVARRPDVVVVGYLGHFDVLLARRLFPRARLVLDHLIGAGDTATDRGVTGGLRHRLLRGLDAAALGSADVVVVDTDEHREVLSPAARSRALVVGVGAPTAWFDVGEPAIGDPTGPLRVVFYGLYTPLQGTPVIGAALAALADAPHPIQVTMIGTGQDLAETRQLAARNPHVTWHDWVDPAQLPAVVARHDVCLGIFGVGPKALRVVPNKVFQGAAAGCALVTSDTAPQRRLLGPAAAFVPPGDPHALAAALLALAADRPRLTAARLAARRLAESSFTPVAVTAELRRVVASPAQEATVPAPTPPLSPNAWLRWDVVSRLLPPGPLDMLEVGCGQGGFGARLAQRYRYVGVEPDAVSARVAQQRVAACGDGSVRHGDLSAVGPTESFDVVVAFEVIEHIEDDAGALADWVGRLRPGGWVLLSTPAWQRRFGPADELVGHFRRYDPTVLRSRLAQAGLAEIEIVHFGAPIGYVLEAGRNAVARRRLASPSVRSASMADRSDASGRTLQPASPAAAAAARIGMMPFRALQRAFPGTGPGLVARGRKPLA